MKRSIPALVAVVLAALVAVPAMAASSSDAPAKAAPGCDPIAPVDACMMPFPNDYFTVSDESTPTGKRVAFTPEMMPSNTAGTPIDPTEWNRNDGFSPGSMMIAAAPGVDLTKSGAAPITDIGKSLEPDAPVVLLDATTGERHPYWIEQDQRATDPNRQALIVRPARNLTEGHRYVVGMRNLIDVFDREIPAGPVFAQMLGQQPPDDPALVERWLKLRPALTDLFRAGVEVSDLYLAWDFTVASTENLTSRALAMRDDSFAALGDAAPKVTVTSVQNPTPEEDPSFSRKVVGTVEVPKYLDREDGGPGSRMTFGSDGRPQANGVYQATFQCNVPRSTADKGAARPLLFGHGLFGNHTAVDGLGAVANEANALPCGASWIGMSSEDVQHIVGLMGDLSGFPSVPDRMQQAYLNMMFLGRAMIHANGLAALPEFSGLLDREAGLSYAGGSLGGIQGTALSALAQDFTRSALVVPAINFSTLLNRATPFQQLQPILDQNYPDRLGQQLGFALLQMVWDRGEGNGYAQHITRDPLPGTPVKQVLLHQAFGDHQVSNFATEVEARTLGLHVVRPALAPGRDPSVEPQWDIPSVDGFPFQGSALVIWDSGSPPPPLGNLPPTEGHDPHGDTFNTPAARQQAAHFLVNGEVIDVCGGEPCVAIPTG